MLLGIYKDITNEKYYLIISDLLVTVLVFVVLEIYLEIRVVLICII